MLRRGAATLERLASSPMIDRLTRFFLPFFSNPSSQTLLAERKTISQNFVSLKTNALLGAGDTHPAETKYHHSSRQKLDCCSSPTADWVLVVWPNFCNEAQKIPTKKPRKGDAKTKPEESSRNEKKILECHGFWLRNIQHWQSFAELGIRTTVVFLPLLFNYSFGAQNFSRVKCDAEGMNFQADFNAE